MSEEKNIAAKEEPKETVEKKEAAKEVTDKKEETKEETAVEKKEPEKPKPKEYSKEEIEEIAKKVEVPSDNTPAYKPRHVLSPEFGGTSNYERGIEEFRQEIEQKLSQLRRDPKTNLQQIKQAEEDLKTLDYLYQNYHIGMNVFRTAKGGRDKLRE